MDPGGGLESTVSENFRSGGEKTPGGRDYVPAGPSVHNDDDDGSR